MNVSGYNLTYLDKFADCPIKIGNRMTITFRLTAIPPLWDSDLQGIWDQQSPQYHMRS